MTSGPVRAKQFGAIQLCIYGALMQSLPPKIPFFFTLFVALQTKSRCSL